MTDKESRARLTTGLGPEGWQWLAFLFAGFVTLGFTLMDDFYSGNFVKAAWHVGLFVVLLYLFLVNRRFRAWARQLLEWIRFDSR